MARPKKYTTSEELEAYNLSRNGDRHTNKGDRHNGDYQRPDTSKSNGMSKFDRARFICWDGEGIEPNDRDQLYALR